MMGVKTSLLKKILTSKSFRRAMAQAAKLLKEEKSLSNLTSKALDKVKEAGGLKKIGLEAANKLKLAANLVYFYATGKYPKMKPKSIMIIIAVLLYFVMPIDLMPDMIPGLGYLDDITLLGWAFKTLAEEITVFEQWLTDYKKAESIDFIEMD